MVKGRIYKIANLDKNKKNHYLISYNHGTQDGIGWLWTSNHQYPRTTGVFADGDAFVCLGKKECAKDQGYYGIISWYEAVGPDGKIHKITPSMRSSYFRRP